MWVAKIYLKGRKNPIIRDYKSSKDTDTSFQEACSQAEKVFNDGFIRIGEGKKFIYKDSSEVTRIEVSEEK